jgi:HEAT repeat protein
VSFFPPSRTITLEAALRDLESGTPKARALAAHALGDVAEPEDRRQAVAALIKALRDDRFEVRAEAAGSLGEIGDESAIGPLADRLCDGDPQVRQQAAIALGTLRHQAGFAPLVTALREGPPDVRFQAATSLAEIDQAAAYEPLVDALGDSDPKVVSSIALSLGAIGDGRAVAPLSGLLEHGDARVRFDAAYALAELGDGRGKAVLAKGLDSDDPQQPWDAATALEWLGAADGLAAFLGKRKADPNAVIHAAGVMLRVGGSDSELAKKTLLTALGLRKLPLRGLAVQELATAGGTWAIEPLQKLRGSRKGKGLEGEIADALRQIEERSKT